MMQFGQFDYSSQSSNYGMDTSYAGHQTPGYNPSILTPDTSQAFSAPPGGDNYDDEPPLMEDDFKEFQVMIENNTKSWSNYNYSDRDICYKHNNAAPVSTSFNITCNKTLFGNQVRILLTTNSAQLVLCDVRIYGECDDGTFGASCTNKCGTHCKGICDKDNGTCESCEPGWTESRCTKECYETTAANYNGSRNTTVDGTKCQRWDAHVPHTHILDRTGIFPDVSATEASNYCRDPDGEGSPWCYTTDPNIRWQFCGIDTCHSECNAGTFGDECTRTCSRQCKDSVCSKLNGVCNEGCIPGYKGRHCNTSCKTGTYGDSCKFNCSGNCRNNEVCRKTDGVCAGGCSPGFKGAKCDQMCKDGKYGDNCTQSCSGYCINSTDCRKTDGICVDGCSPGYRADKCDQKCVDGKYGRNCGFNCSGNCRNNSVCNKLDGSCAKGCKKGYIGNNCNEKCPDGFYGANCTSNCSTHCLNNTVCLHTNGTCINGCDPGWIGYICKDECEHGMYGKECASNCSSNCFNGSVCMHTNGSCINGCHPGWTGKNCMKECPAGTYGLDCSLNCSDHCLNTSLCNSVNGYCSLGCEQGWIGKTCDSTCPNGTYGKECSSNCSTNCLKGSVCLHTNGSCESGCAPGWVGETCQQVEKQVVVEGVTEGVSAAIIAVVVIVIVTVILAVFYMKRNTLVEKFHSLQVLYHSQQKRDENSFHNEMFMHEHAEIEGFASGYGELMTAQNTDPTYANTSLADADSQLKRVKGKDTISSSRHPGGNSCSAKQTKWFTGQNDMEYYNITPMRRTANTIYLSDLEQFMKEKCLIEGYFQSQFETIATGFLYPTTVALKQRNLHKNRFKKMYPYDHSRVKLKVLPGQPDSDYINASFIKGQRKDQAYIAAQGPVSENVNEFWRMIWEIDVRTVIIVTNFAENGKMKCIQYWENKDEAVIYGQINVTLKTEKIFAEFTIREFSVFHQEDVLMKRDITQFHFTAWPDKSVPKTIPSLLHFWRKVRQNDENKARTWLIHCSAGVGRTGTFIALDILFEQAEQMGFIDVYQCVKDLREQRVNLVQTHEQYVCLYKVMLELFCLPFKPVNVDVFMTKYHQLLEKDNKSKKLKLLLEYESLENAKIWLKANNRRRESREEPTDKLTKKNTFGYIDNIESGEFRPILSTYVPGCTNSIKAVYVPSYFDLHEYIIVQCHPQYKMETCRLIIEKDVGLVVTFPTDIKTTAFFELSASENDPFVVLCQSQIQTGEYTIKDHVLQSPNKKHCFKEIVFECWSSKSIVPDSPQSMLNLATEINLQGQQVSDLPHGRKYILFQCSNGVDRSGLVAVLLNVLNRTRFDNEVSIPQVIQRLRHNRREIIPNFKQYKFCYDVLCCHLESNATYANV
ncbi:multiple epidermal growth factor-like domains protein 10 [Mercenaria mercenaria]|uniref:multiple epidermal growth factor-like domains protein 10 n=1 Tax=Mercenaria mercenaria TaxID=6596 RepID=UPI00234EE790|nr:multiple epidermal growth factor-like domains protein 10 [Mercenaria mercenaria]